MPGDLRNKIVKSNGGITNYWVTWQSYEQNYSITVSMLSQGDRCHCIVLEPGTNVTHGVAQLEG